MTMIKVSATSRTSAVAGAIAGVVREHHRAEVQAIGAGAVNQAVKALIVATGYLRLDGIHVFCVPEFADVTIDDKVRTAIKLVVEPEPTPNSSESADVTTEDQVRTAIEPVVEPQRSPDGSEAF
jgi:stage V sporulation protein S